MKSNSEYRAGRRRRMIIIAKGRRKLARIKAKATPFEAPKPWVWQRAVPREA